jgi:hypothetical protein
MARTREGSTSARGYGSRHQAERRRWELLVEAGVVSCVRCGRPIAAGARWHLDHEDDGLHYRGPAHAICNPRAAAKRGNELMRAAYAQPFKEASVNLPGGWSGYARLPMRPFGPLGPFESTRPTRDPDARARNEILATIPS